MDFHFSGTHKSQVLCMVFFSPLINLENFSFSSAVTSWRSFPDFLPTHGLAAPLYQAEPTAPMWGSHTQTVLKSLLINGCASTACLPQDWAPRSCLLVRFPKEIMLRTFYTRVSE